MSGLASYSCHKSVVVEKLCLRVGFTSHSAQELGIHVGDEQKMIVCQVGCVVIVRLVEELDL